MVPRPSAFVPHDPFPQVDDHGRGEQRPDYIGAPAALLGKDNGASVLRGFDLGLDFPHPEVGGNPILRVGSVELCFICVDDAVQAGPPIRSRATSTLSGAAASASSASCLLSTRLRKDWTRTVAAIRTSGHPHDGICAAN
jgi:hypothetical protein